MTRHLFKLVWNRKRASALLILEIFSAFLVVFAVATLGIYLWDNYHRPLGFDYEDVWSVGFDTREPLSAAGIRNEMTDFAQVLREVRSLPQVEAAAGMIFAPYDPGDFTAERDFRGRTLESSVEEVTHGFDRVMGLQVVAGRWFQPGDEALGWKPVVIDQDLAREAFGAEDPVGQVLFPANPEERAPETRVVGVVSDFRKGGELSGRGNFFFRLSSTEDRPGRRILVKIRPGTPASFEKELTERLRRVAPTWSFEVTSLAQMRESSFRRRLAPLAAGGVVAFFLLLMVGLGLIGVLWQNLLQRTREFGLRRAAGASGSQVRRQILLEQLFLTGLGLFLGTLLVVQLPLLDLAGFLSPEVFTTGLLTAIAAMLLLALACSFYPSWMTSRIPPAEALRYE